MLVISESWFRRPVLAWLLVSALLLCLVTSVLNYSYHQRVLERVDLMQVIRTEEIGPMTQLTSSWISGGVKREVVTTKGPDETDEEHARRHKRAFEKALLVFPED